MRGGLLRLNILQRSIKTFSRVSKVTRWFISFTTGSWVWNCIWKDVSGFVQPMCVMWRIQRDGGDETRQLEAVRDHNLFAIAQVVWLKLRRRCVVCRITLNFDNLENWRTRREGKDGWNYWHSNTRHTLSGRDCRVQTFFVHIERNRALPPTRETNVGRGWVGRL